MNARIHPTVRAAVIGVGAMGRNHARVYVEIPNVELAAVADLNLELAQEVTQLYETRPYTDYRTMLREIRPSVVSVVVPTQGHCQVTLDALEAGCHVLVEKPIAATLEEGLRMIERATELGRVLAVGHIERYNPAVIELKWRLDVGELGRIFQIHARRLGPFPQRVHGVGVVVDTAIHDLDIMRYLIGEEVRRLYAEVGQEIHAVHNDLFSGLMRFDNGVLGVLSANWLTPTRIREIAVIGQRGIFLANLLTQDLYFYENKEAIGLDWSQLGLLPGVSKGQMAHLRLQRCEPLRAELEAFVAVAQGEPAAIVSGEDALIALELAQALMQSGEDGRAVERLGH